MLYQVAAALRLPQDIAIFRSIAESMSFPCQTCLLSLQGEEIRRHLEARQTDLLILDMAQAETEKLTLFLRKAFPALWMILLHGDRKPPAFLQGLSNTVLLHQPVTTLGVLNALHTVLNGLRQDSAQGS